MCDHLESITDDDGNAVFKVPARARESDADGNDRVLSFLDRADFDELWLFPVDAGDGLASPIVRALPSHRERAGRESLTFSDIKYG
ncbi:MAG: hypothetical protein M3R69_15620 [Acidobacteriota bacterium]|nr:hypothetical protein [Acidobacteriota bacterium]